MKILDRLFRRSSREASPSKLQGAPMVRAAQPAGYIERPITPELISAGRSVPIVLSSLVGISRLCFSGMDFKVSSLEEGDDTKTDLAMEVKTRIEKMDSKLGRVGKARNVGTIGLVRAAALDGWSYRQAVFEYATQRNDNWLDFSEIQLLPGLSFTSAPMTGGDSLYPDKILPGIVYDCFNPCFRGTNLRTGMTARAGGGG